MSENIDRASEESERRIKDFLKEKLEGFKDNLVQGIPNPRLPDETEFNVIEIDGFRLRRLDKELATTTVEDLYKEYIYFLEAHASAEKKN